MQMTSITWFGVAIALLAIVGLVAPVFTTSQTKDIASIGDVKIQSTEQSTHVVPVSLSAIALCAGIVLIGVGVYTKRGA